MESFNSLLRFFGMMISLAAFALAFGGALLAGVDPLWAVLRAMATFSALMLFYLMISRLIVFLSGKGPAGTRNPDSGDASGEMGRAA